MKEFLNEWKSLIGLVLSMATFTIGCYHMDIPPIELAILFTVLGICTYSWTTYVSSSYKLIVAGLCSFITIMCSIMVLDDPIFISALIAISFQSIILFFLEIKDELV